MKAGPIAGFRALITGLTLLVRPGVRTFVIVPLLINITVFTLMIWWGYDQFAGLVAQLVAWLPNWLDWLRWLLWPLFWLVAMVVVFFSSALVASLIAAPFNGLLAEAVEISLGGTLPDSGKIWRRLLPDLAKSLVSELRKLVYLLLWLFPFGLAALLVPVVGQLLWFIFIAWMLTIEFMDYPMANHQIYFPQQRQRLRQARGTSIGFGLGVMFGLMIPLLNFLIIPAAVSGATVLWVRQFRD